MKTRNKILSVVCLIALLFSTFAMVAINAAEYVKEAPVEPDKWESPKFDTDYAYSFAFVGDTQFITIGDYLLGTKKLKAQYKYIADTAEERKLEHVFVLGDMTDWGYRNDSNLAAAHNDPPITGEWEIVKEAISQLDGVVPYSLVRGNHDDYMMDDYFNVDEYTSMFEGCGGFYSDPTGTNLEKREKKNPDNCIYWSAVTGCHDESIVNSWKTVEIAGTKYLFITYDYNPTQNVLDWLDEILGKYPDHKAIITTHSYLQEDGTRTTPLEDMGNTNNYRAITGSIVWDKVLKKHANVFMVVSGHTGDEYITFSYDRGDNGNKVIQMLVDPQCYETREKDIKGTLASGKQDVGLVLYMNFSKDGKTVSLDYYSTLLGKFLKGSEYVISISDDVDETGYIDMAGFAETPLIEEKKTVNFDGTINDGEYSASNTVKKGTIAKGSLNGDFTEYFAYDDQYIYYGLKTENLTYGTQRLKLHFGSSLYTRESLEAGTHNLSATYTFTDGKCALESTDCAGSLLEGDMECKSSYDKNTKIANYEVRIKRVFLKNNGAPDNLLSHTLNFGNGTEHYYKLTADDKNVLTDLDITKKFIWTYNYTYFGTRPEASEVPPVTTAPPVTEAPAATTVDDSKSGCGSALAITSIAIIPVLAGAVVLTKKKKDN